jgi:hypothetical protein
LTEEKLDVFSINETWPESSDDVAIERNTTDGFVCIEQSRITLTDMKPGKKQQEEDWH